VSRACESSVRLASSLAGFGAQRSGTGYQQATCGIISTPRRTIDSTASCHMATSICGSPAEMQRTAMRQSTVYRLPCRKSWSLGCRRCASTPHDLRPRGQFGHNFHQHRYVTSRSLLRGQEFRGQLFLSDLRWPKHRWDDYNGERVQLSKIHRSCLEGWLVTSISL
jgi:hypothetical protein